MELNDILSKLSGGGEVIEEHDGWLVPCQAHSDKSPSLKVFDKGDRVTITCRSRGCDFGDILTASGLTADDLRTETGGQRKVAEPARELGPAELAPLRVYLDDVAAAYPGSLAAEYASKRFGIDSDTGITLGLGFDRGGQMSLKWRTARFSDLRRLTVPFAGFDGRARGVQGRSLDGGEPRWSGLRNPDGAAWSKMAVFRVDSSPPGLIVAEGPSDALTAVGAGYSAVAIRGASLAGLRELAQEIADNAHGPVFLAGDNDDAGRRFNEALGANLTAADTTPRVVQIPDAVSDLTEWRERDPSAFAAALRTAVDTAQAWVPPEQRATVPDAFGIESSDLANSEYIRDFVRSQGGDVAYVLGVGWLEWSGTHWAPSTPESIVQWVHRASRALDDEYRERAREHFAGVVDGGDSKPPKDLVILGKRALSLRSRWPVDNAISMLKSLQGVLTSFDKLDRDPELLCCTNGTVNLRTGELRPHSKADYITHQVPHAYDPAAKAPRWDRFLGECFPTCPEMPEYLRRVVGYGVTGLTYEHVLYVHHGTGGNGKSIFISALTHTFDPITITPQFSTFTNEKTTDARPDLVQLRGKRLVFASEGANGVKLDESLIKQVTGGDRLTVRALYSAPITFQPSVLINLVSNFPPRVDGGDSAMFRRLRLIPWERVFTGEARDLRLLDTLRAEAPGILAWAVEGARQYFAALEAGQPGWVDPAVVMGATEEYRADNDKLEGFMPGVIARDPAARMQQKEVYEAYLSWAGDECVPEKMILAPQSLKREMQARRVIFRRSGGRAWALGVRLATKAEHGTGLSIVGGAVPSP